MDATSCTQTGPSSTSRIEEATLPAEELAATEIRRRLRLARVLLRSLPAKTGACARIRRRWRQGGRRLREQTRPGRGIPCTLGSERNGALRQEKFPARYRDGVFIAFHGSWDRAPYAQGGYNWFFSRSQATVRPAIAKSLRMVLQVR